MTDWIFACEALVSVLVFAFILGVALVMMQRRSPAAAVGVAVMLALLSGCTRPISDRVKLRAIKAEAWSMMRNQPITPPQNWMEVSKGQWPLAIASLEPESVVVQRWGVDILVKSDFDGGWGYAVPRDKRDLPMPTGCYLELSQGVFWHGPC